MKRSRERLLLSIVASFVSNTLCFMPILATTSRRARPFFLATNEHNQRQLLEDEDDDNDVGSNDLNFLFNHGVYAERKPLREGEPLKDVNYFNNWGIEHHEIDSPIFPTTVEAVATEAWRAIAGTLCRKQRMDPNESSNAMSGSIHGYRPVRRDQDVGRMGIEVDGAQHLYPANSVTDNDAVRRVALKLASKLSQGPWQGFESNKTKAFCRPVAVYFNTIRQSLVASQELNLLKRGSMLGSKTDDSFDHIIINTLGQDKVIPPHMQSSLSGIKRGLDRGKVDPTRGMIIIVQPTDYNDEFRPPGPAVDALNDLQQLTARATAENLAVVIISPRFLVMDHGHWDQSGYQQSSTYGGSEPAKGPTPWVMRDFTPPVYCWVGNGLNLPGTKNRMGLTQSVMYEGHSWHVFAGEQDQQYRYLASTKTSAGRPTSQIMKLIFEEWAV